MIVDEVTPSPARSGAPTLALSLERLERISSKPPQRIGRSATERPLELIAKFLGGVGPGREVTVVDAGSRKPLELSVVVPVEDMSRLERACRSRNGRRGRAPAATRGSASGHRSIPVSSELIRAHHSTIIFCNSRRLAERLAQRLNELAGEAVAGSRPPRCYRPRATPVESRTTSSRAGCRRSWPPRASSWGSTWVPSTSSFRSSHRRRLPVGCSGIGRAGHQVDAPSRGGTSPDRGDLLEAAVVAERMHAGAIETTEIPRNPLDVVAQQIVAMTVMDRWTVDSLAETIGQDLALPDADARGARRRPGDAGRGVSVGRVRRAEGPDHLVPGDGCRRGRRDARVVAVTSGGTISPDPGPFGVFIAGEPGTGRVPRGRARRGDGLRAAGRDAWRRRRPRGKLMARPRDRPRSGHRRTGAGRARQAAVWHGDAGGPAAGGRPGDRLDGAWSARRT